jgi:ribonucleotide reductase, class II
MTDTLAFDATTDIKRHPNYPKTILKRDGKAEDFDIERIENAIARCFASFNRNPATGVKELSRRVVNIIMAKGEPASVENVQDIVEMILQAAGEFEAAKRYILYRDEHARMREERPVPELVKMAFEDSALYFPTPLQQFQFFDKYSRFDYNLGRRETWIETVDRSVDFLHELAGNRLDAEVYQRLRKGILEMKAMPSMRLMAMAGPAARRSHITIYNCSYQPVDSIDAFVEALIISMSGCGVGFSVESEYVEKFPRVRRQTGFMAPTFVVPDSAEGWADALRIGLQTWFEGGDIKFDLSQLRSAGTPLKIKGGRASGPEPLRALLEFVRNRILARQGSFLRTIDAHDIMCVVGNAAVSGGVRRCLPAGTKVHTRKGSIPIEQVRVGDEVMTEKGYRRVADTVYQGIQQLVEITTESGTKFRCTPHHRVAVLTDVWGSYEFKQAQHLTTEDRLLFITHPIDGVETSLLPLPVKRESDHSGSAVVQPVLDTNTAWFMGKFFADGYVRVPELDEKGKGGNTNFDVASNAAELEQIERIVRWMNEHGLKPRVEQPEQENCIKVRSSNRQIARWMYQYKQPKTPLVIPDELWQASIAVRSAFLAGLMDGDGTFSNRPPVIVSTVYEGFARDVVKLLATLGIVAEVRQRRPAEYIKGWQAMYAVTVKDALAQIKCAELLGQYTCGKFVVRKSKQSGYTVPREMARRDVRYNDYKKVFPVSRGTDMNSATLTTLVQATHYVPIKIMSVTYLSEPEHTYDITVEDQHMFVAEGYLVHNTAMISLFDYDDVDMRLAKNGDFEHENSQRWNANNSAVWPEGGLSQMEVVQQVMDMVGSGRGEPGIFNRQAAWDMMPQRRKRNDKEGNLIKFGTNPCLTGDTWVHTTEGPRRINDLIGKQHYVILHGQPFATTEEGFWYTGTKPVFKLKTKEGHELRLTDNHQIEVVSYQSRKVERTEWKEVKDIKPGDMVKIQTHRGGVNWQSHGSFQEGWLLGSLVGDGTFSSKQGKEGQTLTMACLDYWGESSQVMAERAHKMLADTVKMRSDNKGTRFATISKSRLQSARLAELAASYGVTQGNKIITDTIENSSSSFYEGFLQGLFDADGTVIGSQAKGVSVRLTQVSLDNLKAVQRMLLRLGIASTIYQNRRTESVRMLPDGKGGYQEYNCQAYHEVVISGVNLHEFAARIGFSEPAKLARLNSLLENYKRKPNRETFCAVVDSIEPDGIEAVYDCSVPGPNAFDANGFVAHNCGEILLRPHEFCNLSAVVARQEDTLDSLKEKVELATIIGTIQSLATYFPGLRPMWKENCEEERLLGVDITGQLDSHAAQDGGLKSQLREFAVGVNRNYAVQLGINQSASITTVKPSGNTSQLVDCASGLHARWSPYYIRNVRVASHSPIYKVLRDAGVPMDPENGQTRENATTWVIHFPVKSPDGAITRNGRSAIEQCEYWLQNKLYWTEHNPSVTITYRPDEVIDLLKWIWEHRNQIGGMAFLPTFDAQYAQLPYIEISKEEYEKLAAVFPEVDFSKIYRYELSDLTTAAQELACSAGVCEVELPTTIG